MNVTLEEIAKQIKAVKTATVYTHMRPDGDAFGSALSLSAALSRLGIENEVVNESDPPSNLLFLEKIKTVKKKPSRPSELTIAVDSADVLRLGALSDTFMAAGKKTPTINLDHHISNTRYAEFNYVRECAANCMNVATLIALLGVPFDKEIATYLALGLLTDSGNFSHDDVGEEAFTLAAKLAAAGADFKTLNYELFKRQSKARAGLYAAVTGKMRYALDDRFAFLVITRELMERYGADNGMTEGFVDFPLSVDGVEIAASIMEVKKGQYKISLRSKEIADVNGVASVYGGGGHVRAAGCMLFGELEDVVDRLTYTVSQYLPS